MQNPMVSIFPTLFEKLSEGIVYQNKKGEIIYANPAASAVLGLTPDQLSGKTSLDPYWQTIREDHTNFPGEEHPAMVVLNTGCHQENVIMGVKKKDGTTGWIKINSHPITDANGNIEAAVTSFTDITREILIAEKLRVTEQNQYAVLSSIKEGFYLIDRNYIITLINKAAIDLHKKALKKFFVVGEKVMGLFPPHRLVYIKECFERAFKGEKIQYEVEYKDEETVTWLSVTYSPVINSAGEVSNICVGITDISNRKKTEEELIMSERRFRLALSNLGDNAWEHNLVSGKTIFSDRINELFAFTKDKTDDILFVWQNSVHEDDRWMINCLDRDYKNGSITSHSLEYRLKYKDGSVKWVHDRGILIERDANNNPLRVVGTRTDITERKNIEESIKESERKFRAIFNSTFQFVGLMSVDGILLEANQTAIDFFGLPKEEVMGMNFVDSRWFSPQTREKAKLALARAATGVSVNFELELDLLDGRHVVIDFSIRPIFDAQGNVILLVPEGRDITEKLRMEKEIERERINKQKEILTASIEGQEKQRREVARELHDNINQVLATVKIYLQLAGENEGMREGLIKKSYENISHAIEEVRDLSKSLAPPTLDDTTLAEALQEMVNDMILSKLFEINYKDKNFDEGLLDNAQKMTIYRVAQEQFTNILKYSRAKKIIITLSSAPDEVSLAIEDDGIGFNTNERLKGTGIKNMMSRVEAHSGEFKLDSSEGNGCRLQIKLPVNKLL
jgi:PAS domain S-box-containing protein